MIKRQFLNSKALDEVDKRRMLICPKCQKYTTSSMYIHEETIKQNHKVFYCNDCYFVHREELLRKENFDKYGQVNMGNQAKQYQQTCPSCFLPYLSYIKDNIHVLPCESCYRAKKIGLLKPKSELQRYKDDINNYFRNHHFKPIDYNIIPSTYEEHGTFI